MIFRSLFVLAAAPALFNSGVLAGQTAAKPNVDHSLGYDDTPFLPGQPWRVHDISRPHPAKVTPGSAPGAPPSDAVVLFDGKDLSKWRMTAAKGTAPASTWKVANGYFEVDPQGGDLVTRDKFGDCQLHVEWMIPAGETGKGQDAGNSGVMLMSAYEIQVLESFANVTYADGQAGSIYGQWPPLVNASRKEGEWQSYDIFFEAPVFAAGMVVKPAYVTVIHNGVLVQHRKEILGHVVHAKVAVYSPHAPEEPLLLQNHHHQVRYRNIWIRRLKGYDAP